MICIVTVPITNAASWAFIKFLKLDQCECVHPGNQTREQEVTDLVTGVTQSPCSAPCNTTRTTARLVHTIQRWSEHIS